MSDTITLRKIRKGIWGFDCICHVPTFERTSPEKAREWAAEHNKKHHGDTLVVVDEIEES